MCRFLFSVFLSFYCVTVGRASHVTFIQEMEQLQLRSCSCDTSSVCTTTLSVAAGTLAVVTIPNTPNCQYISQCSYNLNFIATDGGLITSASTFDVYTLSTADAMKLLASGIGGTFNYYPQLSATTAVNCFDMGSLTLSATGPLVFIVACKNILETCSLQIGPISQAVSTTGASATLIDPCQSHTSCSACTASSGCGWCSTTSVTIGQNTYSNLPQCNGGTSAGVSSVYCSGTWSFFSCPTTATPAPTPTGPPLVNGCLSGPAYCSGASGNCLAGTTGDGTSYCCPPGSTSCSTTFDNAFVCTCSGYPAYTATPTTTTTPAFPLPQMTTTAALPTIATTTTSPPSTTTAALSSSGCLVGASSCIGGSCAEEIGGQWYCCSSTSTSCSVSAVNGVVLCSCSTASIPAPSPSASLGGSIPPSSPDSGSSASSSTNTIIAGVVGVVGGAGLGAAIVALLVKKGVVKFSSRINNYNAATTTLPATHAGYKQNNNVEMVSPRPIASTATVMFQK